MNRMPVVVGANVATLRASTPDPEVPARVQRRQFTAEYRVTLQKQVAEILGIPLRPLDIDETDCWSPSTR